MASTTTRTVTTARTQALAAQYSRIYGTEDDAYHLGAMTRSAQPAEQPTRSAGGSAERGPAIKVRCPDCGIQVTVPEQQVPALLERWRQDHAKHDEAERRDYAKEPA